MRILLVNWSRLWLGAAQGGGVGGHVQALALALHALGHDVHALHSGLTCVADSPEGPPVQAPPFTHTREWRGITVHEVVNSPVLAPSLAQAAAPAAEVSAPALARLVGELVTRLAPDAVHLHNLEGLSIDAVDAMRAPGRRIIHSLHNYHPICPQVYLMARASGPRVPCHDARGGARCAGCTSHDPDAEIRRRRMIDSRARRDVPLPPGLARAPERAPTLRRILLELRSILAPPPVHEPHAAATPAPLTADATPVGPSCVPIDNDIRPEPPAPPTEYGRRRSAMIALLNRADALLAVSEFVRLRFEAAGVDRARLRVLHIGTPMTELVAANPAAITPAQPFSPDRPLRVVYLGTGDPLKGLPLLAEAIERLEPAHQARLALSVYASGLGALERRLARLEPRLARLRMRSGYDRDDVPWLVGGEDIGVVCPAWWDPAPQVVMEMLACGLPVLGARVGGIPDFVADGVNGLLFHAGDPEALADRLRELLHDPALAPRLRRGVRPPKGIAQHARELEAIYAAGLS